MKTHVCYTIIDMQIRAAISHHLTNIHPIGYGPSLKDAFLQLYGRLSLKETGRLILNVRESDWLVVDRVSDLSIIKTTEPFPDRTAIKIKFTFPNDVTENQKSQCYFEEEVIYSANYCGSGLAVIDSQNPLNPDHETPYSLMVALNQILETGKKQGRSCGYLGGLTNWEIVEEDSNSSAKT